MNSRKSSKITVFILLVICSASIAEPSLTIYNQDFAVVREQLNLNLKEGSNEVSISDITAFLEPDSVVLRDPNGKQALQIIEQNYRSNPVSQGLLLSLNEGREIEFITKDKDNIEKIIKGKIIRSGYVPQPTHSSLISQSFYYSSAVTQPIIEVDGKLRFTLPGEPVFPALADDTILKPAINWILETDRVGPLNAELSYITLGMNWKADYSILAQNNDSKIDVIGWITVDNQTGKTFENAKIKLMAGDVSKLRAKRQDFYDSEVYTPPWRGSFSEPVSEKEFEDFHLYNLNRPTTLHNQETKQVEFMHAIDVNSQSFYIYDGAKIDSRYSNDYESIRNNKDYGTQCNPKVWIFREFKNSKENNLGIPLPKGIMRFYRRNDDGQLEFTGENTIDHTPKDETVRIYTGDAFDLVGERIRTNYTLSNRGTWLDESFEIKVRNRKQKNSTDVRVVEHLYRWVNWEIVGQSDSFIKSDGQTIEFRIHLDPGEEKVISYKVRYSW